MKKLIILIGGLLCLILESSVSGKFNSPEKIDWSKLNPSFAGATFVMNKETCISCHEQVTKSYERTTHSRIFNHTSQHTEETGDCESCHGPRSIHVEEPDNRFAFSTEQYSVVCQQCHQEGDRINWHASMHNMAGVGCVSCHTVMEKRSNTDLLSSSNQMTLCSTCHTDVKAELFRNSRHPVQEGTLVCSSCHNVHGATGQGMLVRGTVNETCNNCHQDKRGPFIWEHPPVREDCLTCHEPHGSNNRRLLTTQNATLCVSCHQYGGHINEYRYNRVSTPYGNGCVNCHSSVHGSNHPSGAKLTR